MPELPEPLSASDPMTLVELVNRVVDRGVSLSGDLTISVADIDLLYLGLRMVLCTPDAMEENGSSDRESRAPSGRGEVPS